MLPTAPDPRVEPPRRTVLKRPIGWGGLMLSGLGGGYLGYRWARGGQKDTAIAVERLSDLLSRYISTSLAAPVIAMGLAVGGALLAAVVIPATVVWTIEKTRTKEKDT